jgi:hypothetical protein
MKRNENFSHVEEDAELEPDHLHEAEEEAEEDHIEAEEHETLFETPVPTTSEEYVDYEIARVQPPM